MQKKDAPRGGSCPLTRTRRHAVDFATPTQQTTPTLYADDTGHAASPAHRHAKRFTLRHLRHPPTQSAARVRVRAAEGASATRH